MDSKLIEKASIKKNYIPTILGPSDFSWVSSLVVHQPSQREDDAVKFKKVISFQTSTF
ncbi:MAG: hypothetical protein ACJAT7_003556 [Psychromonas sp.]|jgi:hypothetical protein|uniref:hypothetical protein n=1 Tax=Psychromonas sp. TaxID=1884585 RepID=UPI0039E2BCF2